MFLVYLLWITLVVGGLFLGIGAGREMVASGFDAALALMSVLYSGCALYSLPKLVRLVFK